MAFDHRRPALEPVGGIVRQSGPFTACSPHSASLDQCWSRSTNGRSAKGYISPEAPWRSSKADKIGRGSGVSNTHHCTINEAP
jgi:hypothetical protein